MSLILRHLVYAGGRDDIPCYQSVVGFVQMYLLGWAEAPLALASLLALPQSPIGWLDRTGMSLDLSLEIFFFPSFLALLTSYNVFLFYRKKS